MVIGNITLKDTGYIKTNNSGTRLPNYTTATSTQRIKGDYMTADNAEITLNGVEINYSRGVNVYGEPTPTLNDSDVSKGSSDNPKIILRGVLLKRNVTDQQVTTAETLLRNLDRLCKSNGYKELYYNSDLDDNWLDITRALGDYDDASITNGNTTYKHLAVRCTDFSIKVNAERGLLEYTLTCEVTKHIINNASNEIST